MIALYKDEADASGMIIPGNLSRWEFLIREQHASVGNPKRKV
jgi:hypothetical protein